MHAIADRLAAEIPGARRATIAGAAHVPSMERPAEFDELVLGFLEGVAVTAVAPAEIVERIWARDATLWTGADEAKWLGWLDEPMRMRSRVGELQRFVEDVAAPGRDRHVRPARDGRLEPGAARPEQDVRGQLLPRPRHDAPGDDPARDGAARLRRDAVHRLVQVRHDARDALAARLLLGEDPQAGRVLRRDNRPGLRARGAREGARLPARLRRRADDRRALLRAVGVRDGSGRAARDRPRAAARPRGRDGRGMPGRRREPRPRAGPRPRRRLAGGPRQGHDQPEHRRLRPLGRAAARGVDREGRQRPRSRARRVARRARPPGARGAAREPVRARAGVLPLGVRDRGCRLDPRDQRVRPAERPGGEGQDERGARGGRRARRRAAGRPRGAARRGGAGRLRRDPGVRRPGARGRARAADRAARGRPAAS